MACPTAAPRGDPNLANSHECHRKPPIAIHRNQAEPRAEDHYLVCQGSRNAPLRLTTLALRAILPSKKSVLAKTTPSPKATQETPRVSRADTNNQNNNGANSRRAIVSRFAGWVYPSTARHRQIAHRASRSGPMAPVTVKV